MVARVKVAVVVAVTAVLLLATRLQGISNGIPALPGEFPFAVHLQIVDPDNLSSISVCGGSIISPNAVLTAAHCILNKTGDVNKKPKVMVTAGTIQPEDFWDSTGAGQVRLVKHIFIHEAYNDTTHFADIAVLVLSFPLEFNEFVSSIQLPKKDMEFNGTATAIGWGDTKLANSKSSVLLKAELEILSNEEVESISLNLAAILLG